MKYFFVTCILVCGFLANRIVEANWISKCINGFSKDLKNSQSSLREDGFYIIQNALVNENVDVNQFRYLMDISGRANIKILGKDLFSDRSPPNVNIYGDHGDIKIKIETYNFLKQMTKEVVDFVGANISRKPTFNSVMVESWIDSDSYKKSHRGLVYGAATEDGFHSGGGYLSVVLTLIGPPVMFKKSDGAILTPRPGQAVAYYSIEAENKRGALLRDPDLDQISQAGRIDIWWIFDR